MSKSYLNITGLKITISCTDEILFISRITSLVVTFIKLGLTGLTGEIEYMVGRLCHNNLPVVERTSAFQILTSTFA